MLTRNPQHRMQDLVAKTGFSERQIRFYITQGLVAGAGCRGPDATYDQATLDRLLLIRDLKARKVQPAGRPLTLKEIRTTIEALGEGGARLFATNPQILTIIDTDDAARIPPTQVREPSPMDADLRSTVGAGDIGLANEVTPVGRSGPDDAVGNACAPYPAPPLDLGDLGVLLRDALRTLEELSTSVAVKGDAAAARWRRLAIGDLEFQVREPVDLDASRRLGRCAAALRTMLSPYAEADD